MLPDPDRLQPLRIPAGWRIDWNKLCPVELTPANKNYFMGSTHFSAVHESNRFWIDVEWRPELDLEGEWHLRVEYQPWPRTPAGRRRQDVPLRFDADAQPVHDFRTRDFTALVADIGCPARLVDGSSECSRCPKPNRVYRPRLRRKPGPRHGGGPEISRAT
jgi:hypothetical protein